MSKQTGKAKAAALASEVSGAAGTATYDGTVYTVPAPLDWPLEVMDALADGRLTVAAQAILGDEQYAEFRSKPRTFRHLSELLDALSAAAGFDGSGN
ncbi:hypothetical protein [Streptosporangium sp. OZ121]|uniref:hypothetical protein n=1 Tax=Streptosporangium sp. OZ121 TaxID=3444183 RepID=UPI003F78EC41